MKTIDVEQVSSQITRMIAEIGNGEDFVIVQNDKPIAKLTAVEPQKIRPQFGSAKGKIWISDDFDEPLEDFKDYM